VTRLDEAEEPPSVGPGKRSRRLRPALSAISLCFCGGAGSRKRQTTPVLRGLAQTPARLPQLAIPVTAGGRRSDLRRDADVHDAVGVHVTDGDLVADAHAGVGRALHGGRVAVDQNGLERDGEPVRASGVATFLKTYKYGVPSGSRSSQSYGHANLFVQEVPVHGQQHEGQSR
jgi:hypothetical protein